MADPGKRIAVVGGGISGLVTAHRIAEAGGDVIVFESRPRAGGVIDSTSADGYLREHAANGFLGNAADGALDLCRELGVAVSEVSPAARRRWIHLRGRLRALPTHPAEIASSDLLSWRGKLRLLAEPLSVPAPGGDESVGEFFRRRLGDEALDAVVEPFVTGIYAGDVDQLSLAAAFPRLAALDKKGGLAIGMLLRAIDGLLSRGERPAPAARIWAPDGGMVAIVDALRARLGDRLRTGAPVVALGRQADRVRVRLTDGSAQDVDRAVLATPAPSSARLVSDASPELAAALDDFTYAPVAVVHLGYARSQVGHSLGGFGFLVARDEPLRILGCVFESVLWKKRAGEGKVLLRCVVGGARDPGAVDLGDAELLDIARTDVERALRIDGEPDHVNIVRWPRAIAQYTLGHLDRVDRAETLARPLGLVLAGASYRGVSVNDCIANARRAAREALAG